MKDLLISSFTKYQIHQIYNYVYSIEKSGFMGDKIMIVYDVSGETINYLKTNGWEVYQTVLDGHVHMHRLISIYTALTQINKQYRYIISTDVKDVIFQHNPSIYLEKNLKKDILASSENVKYLDEPWGTKNILEGYNELLLNRYVDNIICNVGVLAGKHHAFMDLLLLNYLVSQSGNTIHYTDQSSYNFIIHNALVKDSIQIEGFETNWALQIGTLKNKNIINTPQHKIEEYIILHQYDRDPDINYYVNQKLK